MVRVNFYPEEEICPSERELYKEIWIYASWIKVFKDIPAVSNGVVTIDGAFSLSARKCDIGSHIFHERNTGCSLAIDSDNQKVKNTQ